MPVAEHPSQEVSSTWLHFFFIDHCDHQCMTDDGYLISASCWSSVHVGLAFQLIHSLRSDESESAYSSRSCKNWMVRSQARRAASALYSGRFSSKNQCVVPGYV